MLNPQFFTDRNLKMGFKINLDSHHINHASSKITVTPKYPDFGIEVRLLLKSWKNYLLFVLD